MGSDCEDTQSQGPREEAEGRPLASKACRRQRPSGTDQTQGETVGERVKATEAGMGCQATPYQLWGLELLQKGQKN